MNEGTNAVIVCHALTGNTEVDDWWGDLLGPGRALDPEIVILSSRQMYWVLLMAVFLLLSDKP